MWAPRGQIRYGDTTTLTSLGSVCAMLATFPFTIATCTATQDMTALTTLNLHPLQNYTDYGEILWGSTLTARNPQLLTHWGANPVYAT